MTRKRITTTAFLFQFVTTAALSCSVLSHEAVVDAGWDSSLLPLLTSAYPQSTPDDLKKAHGFAYGGAIIQDLGYYPHGNKNFSDLTHYVRTGHFVSALIQDAQSLNELAFALGALSHYSSDINVHSSATNPGEAMLYPKLRRRFGNNITYEKDPAAHLKTEFGFDVLEVAKGRFAPEAYHDFIGFYVANDLVERAFRDTYGLELSSFFKNFDAAVSSYRRDVSIWIPRATRVAWAQREQQIEQSQPGITRRRFVYVMRRQSYEHDWGKDYARPSAGERILAFLLRLLPPVGPLKALQFKMPTPQVESLFITSFDAALRQYTNQLDEQRGHALILGDPNYDIGHPAKPGEYKLEDKAYAYWVDQLAETHFASASTDERSNILSYYADPNAPIATKSNAKNWSRLQQELTELRAAPAPPNADGSVGQLSQFTGNRKGPPLQRAGAAE